MKRKEKIEPVWLPAVPHILHELELFSFVSVKIKENTDVHMVRFSSVVTSCSQFGSF